jgi:hypothetical protein
MASRHFFWGQILLFFCFFFAMNHLYLSTEQEKTLPKKKSRAFCEFAASFVFPVRDISGQKWLISRKCRKFFP